MKNNDNGMTDIYTNGSVESNTNRLDENHPKYKGEIYFSNPPKAFEQNSTSIKAKQKKKKITINTKTLVVVCAILLSTAILTSMAISSVNDIFALNRSEAIVEVNIPEGATTKQIIKILNKNKLIKQRTLSGIFIKAVNKIKKTKEPQYLNGVYYIKSDIGLEAMLNEFKVAQVTAETIRLVFPEGWTIYQIIDKLDEYKVSKKEYIYAALNNTKFSYPFVSAISPNEKRTQMLEGYFFPDTYEFFVDENPNSILNRLLSNFKDKWTSDYSKRAEELGLSIDEIIIIASIIQKEAANAQQMPLVSSVLHNRLAKPSAYPALECNATKDYITRFVKPAVGDVNAAAYLDDYNTYLSPGLPPGPICNPGIKAIEAALYPKETNFNYFQHDDFGKIYMARTFDEHTVNTFEAMKANNRNK